MRESRSHRFTRHANTVLVAFLVICWAAAAAGFTISAAIGLSVTLCAAALTTRFRPALDRAGWFALLILGGLALKDLWPINPAWGAHIRTLDPSAMPLRWLPRNPDLPAAAMQLGAAILGVGLALTVRQRVLSGRTSARRIATGCLAACWAFALLLLTAEANRVEWSTWAPAVSSKNAAATLAALGLVLQLEALRHGWREAKGLGIGLSLIGIGLFIRALATLNSGTGVLAATTGTLVYLGGGILPDHRTPQSTRVWILALVGVGAVVLVAANPNLAGRVFADAPSFRWEIWRDCAQLLAAAPVFGVGCGAFAAVHPLASQLTLAPDAFLAHPDSGYVLALVEWGLLPCALLAALGIIGLARVARGSLEPIDQVLLGGLATLAAAAVTDPTFQRMPTFFLGCALVGASAGRLAGGRTSQANPGAGTWLPPVFGLLGLAAISWGTLAWNTLTWRPLAAELQAQAGAEAWQKRPGDPIALARLNASVELRRWSAEFATYAALQVHAVSLAQAAPLWQLAFSRGRDTGGVFLSRGRAAFPGTPLAYWADLTLGSNPDLALQLHGAEPFVARRIAMEWLARRGDQATPKTWRSFVSFCARNGQTSALNAGVPLMPQDDHALRVAAGRALHALGDAASAWLVLANAFPLPAAARADLPLSPLSAKTLLELGRFDDLQRLASRPEFQGPAAIEFLQRVVLRPGAPPWFRLRLAHAYAEQKNWNQALALLPTEPATQ